jgi:hypothetical protein
LGALSPNLTNADCSDLPVCSNGKESLKVPMCIWDASKEEAKTKCVDSARGPSLKGDNFLVEECGSCPDKDSPPSYCNIAFERPDGDLKSVSSKKSSKRQKAKQANGPLRKCS